MSELNIEVLLESWVILDENYPSFKKNDEIKIALSSSELSIAPTNKKESFIKNINSAAYEFSGKCIAVYYDDRRDLEFVVIDTGLLKFYLYYHSYEEFTVGEYYCGKVTLLVDPFMWKDSYKTLSDAPDIFYNFKVESIIRYFISDEHVTKDDDMIIHLTTLSSEKRKDAPSREVEKIEVGEDLREFFLLNLKMNKQDTQSNDRL